MTVAGVEGGVIVVHLLVACVLDAGDQDTENPITRLAAIFDAEYASEDMVLYTLCHHMADLASQWLSSTVTPEDIRRHFTSCMPNLNAMCKDLLCQTYSNTKLLASS